MRNNIDAIGTSGQIRDTYRRYLQSLISVRDSKLNAALTKELRETKLLDKGPYLEATPPYKPGASIRSLINEGVLSHSFQDLTSEHLPLDRPLYAHQEKSIRKVSSGRNVLVATGTGSGKTESFLLPILDKLIKQKDEGKLNPGVRALLLYPMNALANDQLKRLRKILAEYPDITFGRYTGDTLQEKMKAVEMFKELNVDEPILPNELLSRDEMRESPPHILLTNYAMLEYLLLRPEDTSLFTGGDDNWKFIVVDEAHVYDGSQGAEIAMLLRRLKDRVSPEKPVQCIATSATVGSGSKASDITEFASNLFGQEFQWVDSDTSKQDLITSERVKSVVDDTWGPLTVDDYIAIASSADPEESLVAIAGQRGAQHYNAYDVITHESTFIGAHDLLASKPLSVDDAAKLVFPGQKNALEGLKSLISLGSSIQSFDGTPAISARYHLFLRATEGAFACFSPSGPHIQLARHENCPECKYSMFEIGSCKNCGAVHAVGHVEEVNKQRHFLPRKTIGENTWVVFSNQDSIEDEDEDASAENYVLEGDEAKLCTKCGVLADPKDTQCPGCQSSSMRLVRKLKKKGEEIAGCLMCGARGPSTVRVFETGPDATGAVIATSLYQNLPIEDNKADLPGGGRKLLAFSDSRQSAAYFAPYLETSYSSIQRRRMMVMGLAGSKYPDDPLMVEDLVHYTKQAAENMSYFSGRMSAQQKDREVAPWVMAEAVATDGRQSLEGLGILSIYMDKPENWVLPKPLVDLGLSEQEGWDLLQEIVKTIRLQGVLSMPEEVNPDDEIFAPRLGPIVVRENGSDPKYKILSWVPTKGMNKRLDYLTRVLKALEKFESKEKTLDMVRGIWKFLKDVDPEYGWFSCTTDTVRGAVYQLNHDQLRFKLIPENSDHLFVCSLCRKVSTRSVRNVCPTISCEGVLKNFVRPAVSEETDHYRALYLSANPVSMSASEHTAQWTNTEAASIQHQFIQGKINVLSCSTTFELGVDVGELQSVLLRNMPPSTANYIQRAGRAGRRSGSAALVVTYANRRSHDLSIYSDPVTAMSGAIRTPFVPYANERIDRRHAHSIVLSEFFRWYLENYQQIIRKSHEFFIPENDDSSAPAELLKKFLDPVPESIRNSLRMVLPESVALEIGVEEDAWVEGLLELVDIARDEITNDVAELEEQRNRFAAEKKYRVADTTEKIINNIKGRDILGYLGNKNILPKYGFPTDSVELRTAFTGDKSGSKVELSRDLSQAIYEYAPDSTLVAAGKLWTARGLYKMPGRELERYEYHTCDTCSGYWQARTDISAECPHCGTVTSKPIRTSVIPIYGFTADHETQKPGSRPPKRSWSGATYVRKLPTVNNVKYTLELANGECIVTAGPRGEMSAVADGPGKRGFTVCEWCGAGASKTRHAFLPKHINPMTRKECSGPSQSLDLVYNFQTDLCVLEFHSPGASKDYNAWLSLLYAIVESACEVLEISRRDIDGSLHPTGVNSWSLVLFDRVPGGAGNVLLIEKNIDKVLKAAMARVSRCDCGEETSCYRCLRSYENQRFHDQIKRGDALSLLREMTL